MDTTINKMETGISDPWTSFGYSDWQQVSAIRFRREWMKMMGMEQSEIDRLCLQCGNIDFDDELADYNAMFEIEKLNEKANAR